MSALATETTVVSLIDEYGRPFTSVPWSTWKGRGYRRGRPKQCFTQAGRLSWRHDDLTYAEGWATSRLGLTVHHAWCVTADGRVIDPTWWAECEDAEYFGIAFERVISAKLYLAEAGNHLHALALHPDLLADFKLGMAGEAAAA